MAPRYAPSLRSRLAPLLLFLQLGFIVIYALYVEIDASLGGITFKNLYPGECSVGNTQLLAESKQFNSCFVLFANIYIFLGVMLYLLNVELWGGAADVPG